MTRPDVIVSGGGDSRPSRGLPRWLRRGAASVLVVGALVALGLRVAADEHRRQVALQAADRVDAVARISEAAIGAGGTVIVGVQVLGQGRDLRVDRPRVRADLLRIDVVGAPVTIGADQGNQIRLRLLPRCDPAPSVQRLDIELPITPASGHRRIKRVPFPTGPDLLRRACGYLPVEEAVTAETSRASVSGALLRVSFVLRNDGREPLWVRDVQAPGFGVVVPGLPLPVPPGGPAVVVRVDLRAVDCTDVPADPVEERKLSLLVGGRSGEPVELLPSFEPIAGEYRAWRPIACP